MHIDVKALNPRFALAQLFCAELAPTPVGRQVQAEVVEKCPSLANRRSQIEGQFADVGVTGLQLCWLQVANPTGAVFQASLDMKLC